MNPNAYPDIDIRRAIEAASAGESTTGGSKTMLEDGLGGLDVPQTAGMDIFGGSGLTNTVFELVEREGSDDPTQFTVKNNSLYFGRRQLDCNDTDVEFSSGMNYVFAKIDHSSTSYPELSVEVLTSTPYSTLSVTYRMLYRVTVSGSGTSLSVNVTDYRFIPQIPAYLQ